MFYVDAVCFKNKLASNINLLKISQPRGIAMQTCTICGSRMTKVFEATLLSQYTISYYKCPVCELLQTEKPFWLEQAYSSAIAATDLGLLQRNFQLSQILSNILYLHDKNGVYLDYAGGYGVLCRLMRDIGFDYFTTDAYCTNLFSQDYRAELDENKQFTGISAIEVLEHIHEPLDFFRSLSNKICSTKGILLFTTLLYDGKVPPTEWWYYAFSTGQHISFYTEKTLTCIADKLGMHLTTNRSNFHVFSMNKQFNKQIFKFCTGRYKTLMHAYIRTKMQTRLQQDYLQAVAKTK